MPKADVIGLGRSGIAAARLLKKDGWDVTISDRSRAEPLQQLQQELQREGIEVKLEHRFTINPSPPKLIVVSPGVPWNIPALVEARKGGIDTVGEIELAWRYLQSVPWIAITGTNGKTTTTALIAAIFQTAGLQAPSCGNIGYAACEIAIKQKQLDSTIDWIIAEVSSYQIESSDKLAPQIGIWTTFTPDHLSRHETIENYYRIKASLLHRSQQQVLNGDDPSLHHQAQSWQNAYWTSVKGKEKLNCQPSQGVYLEDGWINAFGELIMPVNLFKMVGEHNLQNLLMAVAAARLAGIDKSVITEAVATFPGVPHRLEYIRTVAGVDFINDSKATNYDAAQVGLSSVKAPVVLIAGGEAKQGDDTGWIETIRAKAAAVLLIGEAAPRFAHRLHQSGYNAYEIVETMDRAVLRGLILAQPQAAVVLLSPACASFDQYQSFEHRGEHFRYLCQQL